MFIFQPVHKILCHCLFWANDNLTCSQISKISIKFLFGFCFRLAIFGNALAFKNGRGSRPTIFAHIHRTSSMRSSSHIRFSVGYPRGLLPTQPSNRPVSHSVLTPRHLRSFLCAGSWSSKPIDRSLLCYLLCKPDRVLCLKSIQRRNFRQLRKRIPRKQLDQPVKYLR